MDSKETCQMASKYLKRVATNARSAYGSEPALYVNANALQTEALDLSTHKRKSYEMLVPSIIPGMALTLSCSTTVERTTGSRRKSTAPLRLPSVVPSDYQIRQIKKEATTQDFEDNTGRRCMKGGEFTECDSDSDTLPLSIHTDSDQNTENDTGKCSSPNTSEKSAEIRRTVRGVTVSLHGYQLWRAFAERGTEMIINRGGRRMFPHINLVIDGLDTCSLYNIILEIVPADGRRYKYLNDAWVTMGLSDPGHESQPFVHPDSPNTGAYWSDSKVSFSKIRLTNNKESKSIVDGIILLQSMHKYKALIKIQNGTDPGDIIRVFDFTESMFVAVTAYQNNQITQLKIQNNPFAKAFRDINNPSFVNSGQTPRRKKTKLKGDTKKSNHGMKCSSGKKFGHVRPYGSLDHPQVAYDMGSSYHVSSKRPRQAQNGYPPMAFMWPHMGQSLPMTIPIWPQDSHLMVNPYTGHPMFPPGMDPMSFLHQRAGNVDGMDSCANGVSMSSSTTESSNDRSDEDF